MNPIHLRAYNVKIRNNTTIKTISVYPKSNNDDSGGHTFSGNFIGYKEAPGYTISSALSFNRTTHYNKIENNTIYRNRNGIEVAPSGLIDLGGGPKGSVGNNILSCSEFSDLTFEFNSYQFISARNNKWDHSPPTFNPLDGTYRTDIHRYNLGNVDIAGHQVAPNPCER